MCYFIQFLYNRLTFICTGAKKSRRRGEKEGRGGEEKGGGRKTKVKKLQILFIFSLSNHVQARNEYLKYHFLIDENRNAEKSSRGVRPRRYVRCRRVSSSRRSVRARSLRGGSLSGAVTWRGRASLRSRG